MRLCIVAAAQFFGIAYGKEQGQTPQSSLLQVFDSTGHPKANGARVIVKYPQGWRAHEGARPKVIQNFSGKYANLPTTLSLSIEASNDNVEGICAKATKDEWREGASAPNLTVTNARTFKRAGKHAAEMEIVAQPQKIDDFVIHSRTRVMALCHGRYIIKAVCSTGGDTVESSKSTMLKVTPLCKQYFDSLRVEG